MHDGMQYDPIQGQGQGHEPLKVGNLAILKAISSTIYNGAGKWPRILKLGHNTYSLSGPDFCFFCPSFVCHVILKLAVRIGVDRQSRMGLIY